MFDFVAVNLYNGYLSMLYVTVFTNIVIMSIIFDKDIPVIQAYNYPVLYKLLSHGQELNIKSMLIWILKGIFQGYIIITFGIKMF